MGTLIDDLELQRLTTILMEKVYKGEKEARTPALLPGSTMFRIKDPRIPDHFMLEHRFGTETSARGQELYYLYHRENRTPLWRMVVDYRWRTDKLVLAGIEDKDARTYLQRALNMGLEMDELLKPPDFPIQELKERLLFRASIDGTLRDFNGQRMMNFRRAHEKYELYLGEIQGGIL